MRITTLLLVSMCVLAILLSAPFVSNAQSGCVPPSHQVVVYTSSQQYLYWKPADPSDNITYDVRWKCPNNTCAGQQIILAANALHTTMGYIGIPLPAGITPTTLKASIFELGCTPNYTICDYRLAGDLITDNIDVIEAPGIDKCYIQTIPPSYAEELSGYANDPGILCSPGNVYEDGELSRVDPHEWDETKSKVSVKTMYEDVNMYKVIQNDPTQKIKVGSQNYYWVAIACEDTPDSPEWMRWKVIFPNPTPKMGFFKENQQEVVLTPNPATHSFLVSNISFETEEVFQVTLQNSVGQVVYEWQQLSKADLETHLFDVSKLLAGIYFIAIQSGEEVIQTKLVKSE